MGIWEVMSVDQVTCKRGMPPSLDAARKRKVIAIRSQSPLEAVHGVWLEMRQLQSALIHIRRLLEHKEQRHEFSTDERDRLFDWLQQALYIEHSVKRLIHSIK